MLWLFLHYTNFRVRVPSAHTNNRLYKIIHWDENLMDGARFTIGRSNKNGTFLTVLLILSVFVNANFLCAPTFLDLVLDLFLVIETFQFCLFFQPHFDNYWTLASKMSDNRLISSKRWMSWCLFFGKHSMNFTHEMLTTFFLHDVQQLSPSSDVVRILCVPPLLR